MDETTKGYNETEQKKAFLSELLASYRRVVLETIVSSFGLGFLFYERDGGDVDTIRNVRDTNQFRNKRYQEAYDNRPAYDSRAYHDGNETFRRMKREARTRGFAEDAYNPNGQTLIFGEGVDKSRRANLDHDVSGKEIHDDRARFLSGIDGPELANDPSNLHFTSESMNKSMQDKAKKDYIEARRNKSNPLSKDQEDAIIKTDDESREAIDKRIAEKYYNSAQYLADTFGTAALRGLDLGFRQAIGFVFIEIVIACEDELRDAMSSGFDIKNVLPAIGVGIKKGFENSFAKHKELLSKLGEGFISGFMASLLTTVINRFVTTDVAKVHLIRQMVTTVVAASNALINNPQDLLYGDLAKSVFMIITTGAVTAVTTYLGGLVYQSPPENKHDLGMLVRDTITTLISGLISCTIILAVDHCEFVQKLIEKWNHYGSEYRKTKESSKQFIAMAAELAGYNIEEFSGQVMVIGDYAKQLYDADDDNLNEILTSLYKDLDLPLPWEGDFDDYMSDPNNSLVFE